MFLRCCLQSKKFQHCCPQRRKIFGVVAFNTNYCSVLLPTMQKSTLISVHVFFCVVAYTAKNLLELLTTTQKNV
jgi:hypothetical protein